MTVLTESSAQNRFSQLCAQSQDALATVSEIRRRFDELRISRWDGAATRVVAGHGGRAAESSDFAFVYVVRGCAVVSHAAATEMLAGGDLLVLAAESGRVESSDDTVILIVHVPSGAVGPHTAGLRAAAGSVVPTDHGTPNLVARFLDGLAADLAGLAPAHPGQLARQIVGLMAMACEDGVRIADPIEHAYDPNVERAKEYIEFNLGDLELGPNHVARALNVSIRTLHRTFEQESLSVAGWIRWRRLENCRSELADRGRDHEAVSFIGARWGFWDAAHFSKLFKAQFGVSPRGYRSQSRCDAVNLADVATA